MIDLIEFSEEFDFNMDSSDSNDQEKTDKRDYIINIEDINEVLADESSDLNNCIECNGYYYTLDEYGRTILVEGDLRIDSADRDISAQRKAGGDARLDTDDGGHYIASRFGGLCEEFNLFPQNVNFNRGVYRGWEKSWAKELDEGNKVYLKIQPCYTGTSKRPNTIIAEATITYKNEKSRIKYYSLANENIRSDEFNIDEFD